jgi:hypothetical protein
MINSLIGVRKLIEDTYRILNRKQGYVEIDIHVEELLSESPNDKSYLFTATAERGEMSMSDVMSNIVKLMDLYVQVQIAKREWRLKNGCSYC